MQPKPKKVWLFQAKKVPPIIVLLGKSNLIFWARPGPGRAARTFYSVNKIAKNSISGGLGAKNFFSAVGYVLRPCLLRFMGGLKLVGLVHSDLVQTH